MKKQNRKEMNFQVAPVVIKSFPHTSEAGSLLEHHYSKQRIKMHQHFKKDKP